MVALIEIIWLMLGYIMMSPKGASWILPSISKRLETNAAATAIEAWSSRNRKSSMKASSSVLYPYTGSG